MDYSVLDPERWGGMEKKITIWQGGCGVGSRPKMFRRGAGKK